MVNAGTDVFRLNFSHVNYDIYEKLINFITEINEEYDLTVGILADLQGPKIRIGEVLNEGFEIVADEILTISSKKLSNSKEIFISYDGLEEDVKPGEKVFINDGKIVLEIISVGKSVKAKVIEGVL